MSAPGDQIAYAFQREVALYDRPENLINYQKFFREPLDNPVGLKTAILRKVFNACYKQFKNHSDREIFDACDQLLASRGRYMRSLALEWASKASGAFKAEDIARFESWLKDHVSDEVFDFVDARKARMPRTALRYAIEKLPPAQRKQLMK
jgi:hypothetical protein